MQVYDYLTIFDTAENKTFRKRRPEPFDIDSHNNKCFRVKQAVKFAKIYVLWEILIFEMVR